jgi:hypothetical protein
MKVQALARTVLWMLLSGTGTTTATTDEEDELEIGRGGGRGVYSKGWEEKHDTPEDGYMNDGTYDPIQLAGSNRRLFLLSFTRRSYPLPQLIATMEHSGLQYRGTVENSCYDVFGNCTDGLTDMWRDCTLVFSLGGDDNSL